MQATARLNDTGEGPAGTDEADSQECGSMIRRLLAVASLVALALMAHLGRCPCPRCAARSASPGLIRDAVSSSHGARVSPGIVTPRHREGPVAWRYCSRRA